MNATSIVLSDSEVPGPGYVSMFSQTTEYALRAMSCLALAPDQLVPTNTLAAMTKVPSNYLAKVLQQLATAKLITGRRGVGGGYRLARPAGQINLLDIVNTVGTLQRITSCPLGLPNHGTNLCALHRTMDNAAANIIKMLDGVTLQNLIEAPGVANKPLCDARNTQEVSTHGGIRVRPTVNGLSNGMH
jgi:Rrf2 family transcriptional regulator, nitric oxide-sensitive transcriptional repressor